MKQKVSIVVPVYKVPEKYLNRCIQSLLNQTLKEIEIILVDDGSPDQCGKICDDFANKDKRIKVIHQKNSGLSAARNSGQRLANGKWIAFVDGDDWVERETYQILYNLAEQNNHDVDVILFNFVKDFPNRSIPMDSRKYVENNKIYKTNQEIKYLQSMMLNYNANLATVPTKFIKKAFLDKNNLFHNEKLRQGAEGIEFNVRLFGKATKALYVEKMFYHYIYNSESITSVHNEQNHYMVLECFKEIKKNIDNTDEKMMDYFYNRMNNVILTTAISGYFSYTNNKKYSIQKKEYQRYLKNDLVQEVLQKSNYYNLSVTKKIILFCIKHNLFFIVSFASKIRIKQKHKK